MRLSTIHHGEASAFSTSRQIASGREGRGSGWEAMKASMRSISVRSMRARNSSLYAIGRADATVKGAEAELATLKDEFKARGLSEVAGDEFAVTASEQIAGRLDSKAVKAFLGDGYFKFEKAIISTVIRIKAANRLALAA